MLLSNDRIMKIFKIIWCQKKGDSFFDLIFVNRIKVFHHFITERLMSSPSPSASKSFLFIKKMNINELIQFARSFIFAFINIDNFENELTSHTSQSLSSLSIHTLQKNASRTQLQIEASS